MEGPLRGELSRACVNVRERLMRENSPTRIIEEEDLGTAQKMSTLKFRTGNKRLPTLAPRYPNKKSAVNGRNSYLNTLSPFRVNKRTDSRNKVLCARFNNGKNYRSAVQVVANGISIVCAYGRTGKENPY